MTLSPEEITEAHECDVAMLPDFLMARIYEEEAVARTAMKPFLEGDRTGLNQLHPMITAHVRLWNSQRVLSACDATRRIVRQYESLDEHARHVALSDEEFFGKVNVLWEALKILSLPYVDHPGYEPEWRP